MLRLFRLSRKTKILFTLTIILATLLLIIVLILKYCVNPIIYAVSSDNIRGVSAKAVNEAVATVAGDIKYDDIISVTNGETGDVQLMQVNSMLVNSMATSIVLMTESNVIQLIDNGVDISLGTLSGITALTGRGPTINIRAFPEKNITYKFISNFKSTGINQTLHTIILRINCTISLVMPGMVKQISSEIDVMVAEQLIIGKIPDTYLYSTSIGDMLNLIP